MAFCVDCNKIVHVASIKKENAKRKEFAYSKEVTPQLVEVVNEMMEKYNIGKRTLSLLLGWGEQTITRYMDGRAPKASYVAELKRYNENPATFQTLLEMNGERITSVARNKCQKALDKLKENTVENNGNQYEDKILTVAGYILTLNGDITISSLQKLLYYAQGFNIAFEDKPLFEDKAEARNGVPIYHRIQEVLDGYKYGETIVIDTSDYLNHKEKALIQCVVRYYGCFSALMLERMIKTEPIYLLSDGENRVIDLDSMRDYFVKVRDKYRMINSCDVGQYAKDTFINVL